MPNFDLLATVVITVAFFLLIMALLVYMMSARAIGDVRAILCTVALFVLLYGFAQLQITLNDLAPNLYGRTLAWSEFESWDGFGWVPNALILFMAAGAAVTLADRVRRPVR